jgi:hypothetical protein
LGHIAGRHDQTIEAREPEQASHQAVGSGAVVCIPQDDLEARITNPPGTLSASLAEAHEMFGKPPTFFVPRPANTSFDRTEVFCDQGANDVPGIDVDVPIGA